MKRTIWSWAGLSLFFGLWLCGMSFDHLRLFNLADYEASDGHSYVPMSHGDYHVPPNHRYRVVIPKMVGVLRSFLPGEAAAAPNADKALFFLVNLSLGGVLLTMAYKYLLANGVGPLAALLATLMLGACRFVLYSAARPIIDMGFLLSVMALVYFMHTGQWRALCLWMPVMILSKEMIYPLLLLPVFLVPKGRRLWLAASYLVSGLVLLVVRREISAIAPVGYESPIDPSWSLTSNSLWGILTELVFPSIGKNIGFLFSARGGYDVLIAFGILWVFAGAGLVLRVRHAPWWVWVLLPLAIGYGTLNWMWGRMLTMSFPLVILYAARAVDALYKPGNTLPAVEGNRA
jgi:hypothetical protein